MINPNHQLSLTRQAQILQLSRASPYYEPVAACEADLQLMRRIDELHLHGRSWAAECCAICCGRKESSSAAGMLRH